MDLVVKFTEMQILGAMSKLEKFIMLQVLIHGHLPLQDLKQQPQDY
jgi:hypothetical protein